VAAIANRASSARMSPVVARVFAAIGAAASRIRDDLRPEMCDIFRQALPG
jgi:hypothetical protein